MGKNQKLANDTTDDELKNKSSSNDLSLFGKIVGILITLLIFFGIFWITPARGIFNRITQHPVQCTIESSEPVKNQGVNASLSLTVDTADCGTIFIPRNSDEEAAKDAEELNNFKGQKVTFQMGLFARGVLGTQANSYILPD